MKWTERRIRKKPGKLAVNRTVGAVNETEDGELRRQRSKYR
jgi:hypothetical protein